MRKASLRSHVHAAAHKPSRKEWPAPGRASVRVSGLNAGQAGGQVWELQCSHPSKLLIEGD